MKGLRVPSRGIEKMDKQDGWSPVSFSEMRSWVEDALDGHRPSFTAVDQADRPGIELLSLMPRIELLLELYAGDSFERLEAMVRQARAPRLRSGEAVCQRCGSRRFVGDEKTCVCGAA